MAYATHVLTITQCSFTNNYTREITRVRISYGRAVEAGFIHLRRFSSRPIAKSARDVNSIVAIARDVLRLLCRAL